MSLNLKPCILNTTCGAHPVGSGSLVFSPHSSKAMLSLLSLKGAGSCSPVLNQMFPYVALDAFLLSSDPETGEHTQIHPKQTRVTYPTWASLTLTFLKRRIFCILCLIASIRMLWVKHRCLKPSKIHIVLLQPGHLNQLLSASEAPEGKKP